jgi:GT2 family glycosyltransferase
MCIEQTASPYFSVIIPTYNNCGSLVQAVACVWRQQYARHHYELIVVDDGSSDATLRYLRACAANGWLRYHTQHNAGPAAARNAGARLARGAVLVFTDDDCLPTSAWLQALAASFQHQPIVAAVGGHIINRCDTHWLTLFACVQEHHAVNIASEPEYLDTANAAYRADVFWQIGGFDERFPFASGEDADLSLRCRARGHTLQINPQALVWHTGRTSLRRVLQQAWIRGLSDGYLRLIHPHFRPIPTGQGWRLYVRHILDTLTTRTISRTALLQAMSATLRIFVLTIPETGYFARTLFPQQMARYQAQSPSLPTPVMRIQFAALVWGCYILRYIGRVVGTWRWAYMSSTSR